MTRLGFPWAQCCWRSPRSHPDAWAILAVGLLALGMRLAFEFRVDPLVSKDSQSYFLPAWDLVRSGELQLGLRRTPGYPGFLALVLVALGDDLRGVTLAQHLLGVATAVLAYLLGKVAFGRSAGLVAGLLAALSAPLLAYEHFVLTEALFTFVLTAALTVLVAAWRRPCARRWLLGGLLVGAAALVRPVGQLVLPLALLAALVASRGPRAESREPELEARERGIRKPFHRSPLAARLPAPLLVLAGFALLVVPWTIRNQITHNLATPSTFGRTLIARTASYDRGFVFYDRERPPDDADPRRVRARRIVQQGADNRDSDGEIAQRLRQELDLGPVEVNALMRDLAIEAILAQPLYFAQGTLRFALRIFNGVDVSLRDLDRERRDVVWDERTRHLLPAVRAVDDDFRAASRQLGWYQPARFAPLPLVLFTIGLVAALAVPGWRPGVLPGVAVVALILASAALDGPQERYRYPADPAIGVLVAGGLVALATLARALLGRFGRPVAPTREADVGDPTSLALSEGEREHLLPLPGREGWGRGGGSSGGEARRPRGNTAPVPDTQPRPSR